MKKLLGDDAGWLEDGPLMKQHVIWEDQDVCWKDQEAYWEDANSLVQWIEEDN